MRKLWLLAAAVALITTACRMEVNVLMNLEEDGSGSFGIEFGTDEELRNLMSASGESIDFTEGLGADVPGATVTQRTEGDMEFNVVTFEFADQAALQSLLSEADDTGEFGNFDIVYADDTVTVNATLEGAAGLGNVGDAAGDLGGDFDIESLTSGFADSFFSGSVIISMPGEVTSHNADRELGDGRLQWDLDLDGSDIVIMAVSDLGGGSSFPIWAIVLLVVVALAIVFIPAAVRRRRRTAVDAVAAADAAAGGAAPMGWTSEGDAASQPGSDEDGGGTAETSRDDGADPA